MMPIEEVITELKRLSPDQVEEVARMIHRLSEAEPEPAAGHPVVPARIIDEAVKNGWPVHLFTDVIGSLPDLNRAAQPPLEVRPDL